MIVDSFKMRFMDMGSISVS